jgi:hypothetical protein
VTVPALETSSASTSSTSSPASTAASMSCAPLIANAYSRNRPFRVTLNRASDGRNGWKQPRLKTE